jgi:carboxypeptidase T
MKKTNIAIIALAVIIIIAVVGIYLSTQKPSASNPTNNQTGINTNVGTNVNITNKATDTAKTKQPNQEATIIGTSAEGRAITAYHYGNGATEILLVGGIHGGYEWNTSLLAYETINYFKANPTAIPANIKLTIIPVLNPDGLNKVISTSSILTATNITKDQAQIIAGRFNGNNVDLNRNFDCNWKAAGTWQNKTVSGGSVAFSEPESLAVKNYIETNKPSAVVVYYSAAGGVFSSSCNTGILAETNTLTKTYAKASGYPAYDEFTAYETTGDMVNWLAKEKIPAISVLLTDHADSEWDKNLAGINSILKYFNK